MNDFAVLSNPEVEACEALAEYRAAIAMTNHRSAWHRILCWCGDLQARRAEHALLVARRRVRGVARRSDAHRHAIRDIGGQQLRSKLAEDSFLSDLCT